MFKYRECPGGFLIENVSWLNNGWFFFVLENFKKIYNWKVEGVLCFRKIADKGYSLVGSEDVGRQVDLQINWDQKYSADYKKMLRLTTLMYLKNRPQTREYS